MDIKILDCGHPATPSASDISTGYGTDAQGKKHCYGCIALMDKKSMEDTGRQTMYLVNRDGKYFVTNWPASLEFPVTGYKKSWHNMAGKDGRIDFWFIGPDGKEWHGYQIGQYNEIAHCKRNK